VKQSNSNEWTRRHFLGLVARAGGAAAVYETMTALGLINVPVAWSGPPQLPRGRRRNIVVLGSGIGGLTVSYLLSQAGHRVRILEAQDRGGGRSLTARRGTVVDEETEEQGWTRQVCDFDDGLYVNLGPGRIPHHHRRVLHYCAELGVPLEVFVMGNAASLFQTDKAFQGQPQVRRRIAHDARGYLAELLSKAVNQSALYDVLDAEDQERLLDLLRSFGALGTAGCDGRPCAPQEYCGSLRAGLREDPTVQKGPCAGGPPLELSELLRSEFWLNSFYNPVEYDWQATLFQPVGGMDQIVAGFLRALRGRVLIQYAAQVKAISIRPHDVRVTYLDSRSGLEQQIEADACISNIPLPLLRGILAGGESNVSAEFRDAVAAMDFNPGCKVGWQANRRFWELDDQIYGGMSFIDHPIIQMWYPSNDYSSKKGAIVGAYTFGEVARAMGEMSLVERLALTREGGEKLHPQIADPTIVPPVLGISVAWQNVPWQRGAFPGWTDTQAHRQAYQRLLAPDQPDNPRLWLVGDQVGSLGAWQEGAMMSAEWVAQQVTGAIPSRAPEIFRAPESRQMLS
jgi:monoamine oxidase